MKYSVKKAISDMQAKLLGHVAVMSYGYCQLCVKADASSLLGVEVMDGSLEKHIEDVADVYVHDEENDNDKIDIVPKHTEFFQNLLTAIHDVHPEFKITIESGDPDDDQIPEGVEYDRDSLESKYIRLTMPEVDKNRRDLINTSVDTLNQVCKTRMTACQAQCSAKVAELLLGAPAETADEAKKAMDEVYNQYKDMCDNLTDEKKQEVEDAYQRYLTGVENEQSESGTDSSVLNNGQSLRL